MYGPIWARPGPIGLRQEECLLLPEEEEECRALLEEECLILPEEECFVLPEEEEGCIQIIEIMSCSHRDHLLRIEIMSSAHREQNLCHTHNQYLCSGSNPLVEQQHLPTNPLSDFVPRGSPRALDTTVGHKIASQTQSNGAWTIKT